MKQRSRIIKPEFFQNRKLAEMSAHHRLLFIGLWTIADRDGKLQDDSDLIKAMVFPFESIDVGKMLVDLADLGFIERYNGGEYACIIIPKFLSHQSIHWNESDSQLPEPQEDSLIEPTKPLASSLQVSRSRSKREGKGRSKDQEIPFEEIISHLNILAQKKRGFDWATDYNQKQIKRRWGEGRRLADFLYVNQVKSEEWLATDMEKHLNPETLYGNKMEKYLNQRRIPRQYSEKTNRALIAAAKFLDQKGFTNERTRPTEVSSTDAEVIVSISQGNK